MVAAIPAGLLAYLLVMVFLTKADGLPTILQILAGLTLACAALIALMPIGLLIFGGKRAPKDAADKPSAKAGKAAPADDEEEIEAVEDLEEASEIDDDASAFDVDESDADIMADSDDEITSNDSSLDEIESVDFDDDDDEPAPKKRKK